MAATAHRPPATLPTALAASILSGFLAALGVVALYGTLAPDRAARDSEAGAVRVCRYCGTVERVSRIENAGPRYEASTVTTGRDEGILMLLGALSGATIGSPPPTIYEVSVRMDDGSVRAVREARRPPWKAGDPVNVMRGQVTAPIRR